MGPRRVIAAVICCGCGAQLGNAPDMSTQGDARSDSPRAIDAPSIDALGAWSTPAKISGASDAALQEDDCTLSTNKLELYFTIPDTTITGNPKDLYLMTRTSEAAAWGPKQLLATLNTAATEESPRLSPDDLTLYFGRGGDIYQATRNAIGQPWDPPTAVTSVNTASYEKWFAICTGNVFLVSRANDLYQGTLGTDAGTAATELNTASNEIASFLSPDCLTTYFASNVSGQTHIYTATRPTASTAWSSPTEVTTWGTGTDDEDPWVSADTRTAVFASQRGGATTKDLYITTR
jgi:hypothetical protein